MGGASACPAIGHPRQDLSPFPTAMQRSSGPEEVPKAGMEVLVTDTLRRLARLRQLEENQAQRAHVDAQAARERHEAELAALEARMQSLREVDVLQADDLSRSHARTLHLEMARRRQARQAPVLEGRVQRASARLQAAVRETRRAERFVEIVEEREALEAARADQAELDALGTRSWLRRRAA